MYGRRTKGKMIRELRRGFQQQQLIRGPERLGDIKAVLGSWGLRNARRSRCTGRSALREPPSTSSGRRLGRGGGGS